nr:TonB-dependent receptor [Sphingobium sp. EM0848]
MAGCAIFAFAIHAHAASAQEGPKTSVTEGRDGSIADIVVTANRREERLQDVPASVTAVSADLVAARGLSDLKALNEAVPSLVLVRSATSNTPFLRGIGAAAASPSNEPSVATYVDNVYIPSNVATVFDFNNIERIEVLRGPQGTLFGRNAVGGVLHVITRDPTATPAMDMDLTYANYDTVVANAYASGGISDNLSVNFAGHIADRNKGWGRNIATGKEVYTYSDISARAKLLWTPGPDTRILLAADIDRFNGDQGVLRTAVPGTVTAGATANAGFYNVNNNVDARNKVDAQGGSLRVDQDFGGLNITSITSYRSVRQDVLYDLDASVVPRTAVTLATEVDTFSQELQLKSAPKAPVRWILGAFYFNDKTGYAPQGVLIGTTTQQYVNSRQSTQSFALYGQATFELFDRTSLTAGLRYTADKRKIEGRTTVNGIQTLSAKGDTDFNKMTWRLSLDHRFTNDVMAYVSYNRGFKSGVYDVTSYFNPAVAPEILDAYEVGLKTDWFDRHLRVNISAFHYDYSDIQVTQILGTTAITVNAAKARVNGAELEVTAMPVEGLSLTGGLSLLDAKYKDFRNGPHFSPNGAAATCAIIDYPANAPGGQTQVAGGCDFSGNRMIFSPPMTVNVAANYTLNLANGSDLLFNLSYFHTARFYFEPDHSIAQNPYGLLSASLGWRSADQRLGLRLWGKNLTNEQYFAGANSTSAGRLYSAAEPRTYGFTLSYHFD